MKKIIACAILSIVVFSEKTHDPIQIDKVNHLSSIPSLRHAIQSNRHKKQQLKTPKAQSPQLYSNLKKKESPIPNLELNKKQNLIEASLPSKKALSENAGVKILEKNYIQKPKHKQSTSIQQSQQQEQKNKDNEVKQKSQFNNHTKSNQLKQKVNDHKKKQQNSQNLQKKQGNLRKQDKKDSGIKSQQKQLQNSTKHQQKQEHTAQEVGTEKQKSGKNLLKIQEKSENQHSSNQNSSNQSLNHKISHQTDQGSDKNKQYLNVDGQEKVYGKQYPDLSEFKAAKQP